MKKMLLAVAAFVIVIALVALAFLMQAEGWAYDYEPEVEILSLGKTGRARYQGESYRYQKDDRYLVFTGNGGKTFRRRYEMGTGKDGEEVMFLYEPSVYSYAGEEAPDGLVGLWQTENGWSFQFNGNGTFIEDTYFVGYYSVEQDEGRIKLVYDSEFRFNDTYIYFQLDGDRMTLEYPWRLLKTKKSS